jgi:hypothetical protein
MPLRITSTALKMARLWWKRHGERKASDDWRTLPRPHPQALAWKAHRCRHALPGYRPDPARAAANRTRPTSRPAAGLPVDLGSHGAGEYSLDAGSQKFARFLWTGCVIGQGVEFVVAHHRQGTPRLHHGSDHGHHILSTWAAVYEVP